MSRPGDKVYGGGRDDKHQTPVKERGEAPLIFNFQSSEVALSGYSGCLALLTINMRINSYPVLPLLLTWDQKHLFFFKDVVPAPECKFCRDCNEGLLEKFV